MKCGYKIDAKARLAIYNIIGQLQQGEMIVTVNDIKALIDNAIQKKKTKNSVCLIITKLPIIY